MCKGQDWSHMYSVKRQYYIAEVFLFCAMLGPAEGEEDSFTHQLRGVIPRAFEYLFSLVNREQEKVIN